MGKQDVKDNVIDPIRALQAGNLTFAAAQQMYNGVIPIGDYKGVAAALDLDLLVKQPLVLVEQKFILGILDGREEDYDLQTLVPVAGEVVGTNHDAALVVPDGEVWYLNAVRMHVPITAAMTVACQWYCDLWPDHDEASPSGYGQRFFNLAQTGAAGVAYDHDAEFGSVAPVWGLAFKEPLLRLPGGTTLRCRFTPGVAVEVLNLTFQLFGFIAKPLVD